MMLHELVLFGRETVACELVVGAAVCEPDRYSVRLAEPSRRLDEGIEHCSQIEGRTANDFEHVGGGRLLLQRFTQFVEQPRVPNGDDGLSREALEKFDFPLVESSYLLTVDNYCSNYFAVLEHRHDKERSHAADLRKSSEVLVGWV